MIRIKRFGTVVEQDGDIRFEGFQFHESSIPDHWEKIQYDTICDAVIARIRKAQDIARRLNALSELQRQLNSTQEALNIAKVDNILETRNSQLNSGT